MKGRIRQRSPGTWQISYEIGRDALGKRRRKAETIRGTKAEAQRRLREVLTALDQGRGKAPTLSLAEWLAQWMRDVVIPNRRQGTVERYSRAIRNHVLPHAGSVALQDFGPAQVQALESRLSGLVGAETVNLVHAVLSGACKHALRLEMIHRNPVALVTPPPVKRREVPPPDVAGVRRALELAREDGHDLHAAMHLIAYTGLRRGEALALLWRNVDLERGYLAVEGALVRRSRGVALEPPKTATSRRLVDLDPSTVEVLAAHRDWQVRLQADMRGAYVDNGRVFVDEYGGWASPQRLYKAVKTYGQRAGVPALTVHSLRHFHATLLLQSGQNIVVVSKRLGHSQVSMTTDIYAHALPGWQREAAEAFAAAMER